MQSRSDTTCSACGAVALEIGERLPLCGLCANRRDLRGKRDASAARDVPLFNPDAFGVMRGQTTMGDDSR